MLYFKTALLNEYLHARARSLSLMTLCVFVYCIIQSKVLHIYANEIL